MELLKRAATVYLLGVAAVVAIQMIFSPFYRNVMDNEGIWHILNWFMAASIIITLVVRCCDKMQVDREDTDSVSRRYLATYSSFVASVFLGLLFFWNWADVAIASAEGDINLFFWSVINPLFVVVTGLTGCRLLSNR